MKDVRDKTVILNEVATQDSYERPEQFSGRVWKRILEVLIDIRDVMISNNEKHI